MLVYERKSGGVVHSRFHQLGKFLGPGDLLVINNTRVIPARVFGRKAVTGGKVELLLLEKEGARVWQAWVGGSGLREGRQIQLADDLQAEIIKELDGPLRVIKFQKPIEPFLEERGEVPLPPYIHTDLENPEDYQTVYAAREGSSAAPTAGLHFTPGLLEELRNQGVETAEVTLHVGLDTFAPVHEGDPHDHQIHSEFCWLPESTAEKINRVSRQGGRVIAVGTTTVRTLETAARRAGPGERVAAFQEATELFILPGFEFRAVDALITNFHLPESTLLMLVSAFVGREKILSLYRLAMEKGYRFYSFGDAMLLA